MGRSAMKSLTRLWKSKDITLPTKLRLLKTLVWSIAIYGSEGWTIHKKEEKYIEAFEMWCYRRLLRVSWTEHRTNEWILEKLNVEKELLHQMKRRKLSYYGHIIRKKNCLEKDLIQGCTTGCRSQGGQRRRWKEDISEWTGQDINVAARSAVDRDQWKDVLHAAHPSTGGWH